MLLLVRIQQWEERAAKPEPHFSQLLRNLHEQLKGAKISFELASINQHIYFFLNVPNQLKELMVGQIYAIYPDAVIEEVDGDYANSKAISGSVMLSAQLGM
ncbi:MAG: hypothetical protein QF741_04065, partial [Candidatus Peribacteraceae bacterium]|nr:hypothetical protein [Candidatus Peribacteraceae bacterium]